MENIISNLFDNDDLDGCTVEYYPHIEMKYNFGGSLKNEKFDKYKINMKSTEEQLVEYIFRDKKLTISEDETREYSMTQQKQNIIKDGLFIVSKIECIDPNRFPILNEYYDISKKNITKFEFKYITLLFVREKNINYIKITFQLFTDKLKKETYKRKTIRDIKEAISLLQQTE